VVAAVVLSLAGADVRRVVAGVTTESFLESKLEDGGGGCCNGGYVLLDPLNQGSKKCEDGVAQHSWQWHQSIC
jgi:hypothetical protein